MNVHSYQTKTKQNKKHFLSFLHRQNYLHAAACYIFSLRRTDPCHPCKTFRWKDFLISSRLSMGSWTNSCAPLFFSWNCRPWKREPHLSDVKRTFMEEENKVSQYSAFSIKSNGRSVRWACGLAWSHGAKGRFSFAWFSCSPLLYSWSTQGKWKDSSPPSYIGCGLVTFSD